MVTVQVATLPEKLALPQVLDMLAGAGDTLGTTLTRVGARPELPGSAVTVTVKVWAVPTALTPLAAIATVASTYFFVAGPELNWPLPAVVSEPSVVRTMSGLSPG